MRVDETSDDPEATAYAIRFSQTPITNETAWNQATPAETVPPVFGPNIRQEYTLRGLNSNMNYYVAIRVYNENHLGGPISSIQITTKEKDTDSGTGVSTQNSPDNIPPTPPTNLQLELVGS